MRFGVTLPQFGPFAAGPAVHERIARVATAADRLGYDVVWTAEHFVLPREIRTPYPYGGRFPFPVTDPFLEVVSTLSYVAALTERVHLSAAVMIAPYRHPVVLAKELATLDVLSAGRLIVGLASGWLAEEFAMLGVPFHERGARTDETLELLRVLWTEDRVTFRGRFVTLEDAAFFPKPFQRPHPPIWIGGRSARAFDRVARWGAGWIAAPRPDLDTLARDVERLHRRVEAAGRDPGSVGVASGGAARDVDELVARLPALARAGVTIVTVPALFWGRSIEHALEIMELFATRAGMSRLSGAGAPRGSADG
jgi:probable F420-dependent oxidoreductase